MADITSSDVTITISATERFVLGKLRMVIAKIEFGDGTLTYPTGGIPLPTTMSSYGFNKAIVAWQWIDDANANGYVYKYDKDNNKIRIYYGDYSEASDGPLVEVSGSHAPDATDLYAMIWGK